MRKLFTPYGVFDTIEDHDAYLFAQRIDRERKRQVELGYTNEHDDAHGLEHLLRWAFHYAAHGKTDEGWAMVRAAIDKIERERKPVGSESD